MIEKWIQITCDACGNTESGTAPNETAKLFREEMQQWGWKNVGALDYCRECVASGAMKRRETGFGCGSSEQSSPA